MINLTPKEYFQYAFKSELNREDREFIERLLRENGVSDVDLCDCQGQVEQLEDETQQARDALNEILEICDQNFDSPDEFVTAIRYTIDNSRFDL